MLEYKGKGWVTQFDIVDWVDNFWQEYIKVLRGGGYDRLPGNSTKSKLL